MLPLELEGSLLTKMAAVTDEAVTAVAHIPGATVEDNQFSVSIHFRNCAADDWYAVCTTSHSVVSH